MNKPIFVVGSPRSGTSILTWCLGQHSNILGQEESDWLGRFSLDVEAAYGRGSQRAERSQFGALDVRREELHACFGNAINDLIIRHRHDLTRIAREQALAAPGSPQILPGFKTERAGSDPKQRWVDGTPEYSFYICGLRKLFPEAVFIHILREVSSVVRSILHFDSGGEATLVENEEQAYDYWLRTVRACRQAERAYGPTVVRRLRYSDLIDQPEAALRSLLEFLGEPYESTCLEPLRNRINSSQVPPAFESAAARGEQRVIEEARRLESELMNDAVAIDAMAETDLELQFQQRVNHNLNLNSYYRKALTRISKLEKEIEQLRSAQPRSSRRWSDWIDRKKTSA